MTGALAAIAAHRAAYDAFQVAVGDDPSLEAEDAYDAASDALVATDCTSPSDAEAMLAHLRWWIGEEVEFRKFREPAYGIAEARVADLTLALGEGGGISEGRPDPVFAALAAASRTRREHLSALDGLNEDDEAQMRRANAAADAESNAFEELAKVIPTTLIGLRTLAERYALEAEEEERWATGARYLRHVVQALRAYETDRALFRSLPNAPVADGEGRA